MCGNLDVIIYLNTVCEKFFFWLNRFMISNIHRNVIDKFRESLLILLNLTKRNIFDKN